MDSQNLSNDFEVLGLFYEYQIVELQKSLSIQIPRFLNSKNVFKILDIANLYNLTDLVEACNHFLDLHAGELKSNEEFYNLSQVIFFMFLIIFYKIV